MDRESFAQKRQWAGDLKPSMMRRRIGHNYKSRCIYMITLVVEGRRPLLGSEIAASKGLILVDTKYEFGKYDGKVILMDEIHTPDSSRYFYADGFEERLRNGEPQRQLSKEFVRQWLIEHDFMGQPGQQMPEMTDQYCQSVAQRYIELYEEITGERFEAAPADEDLAARIQRNVTAWLAQHPQR